MSEAPCSRSDRLVPTETKRRLSRTLATPWCAFRLTVPRRLGIGLVLA